MSRIQHNTGSVGRLDTHKIHLMNQTEICHYPTALVVDHVLMVLKLP